MNRLQGAILRWHVTLLALVIPDVSRRLPLARLLARFTPRGPSRLYAGVDAESIVNIVRERVRRPWRMRGRRCLRHGLLLFHFLRLTGRPAVLHFCVYKQSLGREQAHCWVTLAGRAVSDPPEADHVVILVHGEEDLPRAGRAA